MLYISDSLVVYYQFHGPGVSTHWVCCHYSGKFNL